MARIRTTTYTMEKNFCGRCGIILSKRLDIFDRCPKCKEVIEAWNDHGYVDKHLRTIKENIHFKLVVVYLMERHDAVIVIYPGLINNAIEPGLNFFYLIWIPENQQPALALDNISK